MTDIEESLNSWKNSLCKEIDAGSLFSRNPIAHKWKAPWRILLLREVVAWRLVDLLIQSVYLHKAQHILGARILVRSAFETLSILIYANQEMRRVVSGDLNFHEFSDRTCNLLLGSRDKTTNLQAINIITILQRADKRFPGLYTWYEALSESAHPNCEGMLAGYSQAGTDDFLTVFENRWNKIHGTNHLSSIQACMAVFDAEYNHEWPSAFEEMENWIKTNDKKLEESKPK